MATTKLSREEKREKNRLSHAKWREAHREDDRAKSRAYAKANPEKRRFAASRRRAVQREIEAPIREALRLERAAMAKERARGRSKKYCEANREAIRNRQRAWVAANRERMRELLRAWKRANPEKRRAERQRKAKSIRASLSPKQRGRCAYCRKPLVVGKIHIDHIQPRIKGGSNERRNLQLTCVDCNLTKNARDPIDFARSRGMLL